MHGHPFIRDLYRKKEAQHTVKLRAAAAMLLRELKRRAAPDVLAHEGHDGGDDVLVLANALVQWVDGLVKSLEYATRKARRYQAELLLAIGDEGESV